MQMTCTFVRCDEQHILKAQDIYFLTVTLSYDRSTVKIKKCRPSVTLSTNHIKALQKRLQSRDVIGWKYNDQKVWTSVILKIVWRFDGKTVDVLGLIFAKLNFLCIEFLFKACWILMYGFHNLFFSAYHFST